jgi:hypothetical protein
MKIQDVVWQAYAKPGQQVMHRPCLAGRMNSGEYFEKFN